MHTAAVPSYPKCQCLTSNGSKYDVSLPLTRTYGRSLDVQYPRHVQLQQTRPSKVVFVARRAPLALVLTLFGTMVLACLELPSREKNIQ